MGRPSVFASQGWTVEALEAKCHAILDEREALGYPPTIQALACELRVDPMTIQRYAGLEGTPTCATDRTDGRTTEDEEGSAIHEFGAAIKSAVLRIHRWFAERLPGSTCPTGGIFVAKATLGWRDQDPRTELQVGDGTSITFLVAPKVTTKPESP